MTGELHFTSGRHSGKKYAIEGYFKNPTLTFIYTARDRRSTSQGTGTFERVMDGTALEGAFSFYSPERPGVSTIECRFVRVEDYVSPDATDSARAARDATDTP